MTDLVRPPPAFIADDRALDLLNSIAAPSGTMIEWLGNGQDLLDWLEWAGLVPPEVLRRFRQEYSAVALDEIASEARDLREWFRGFVHDHAGAALTPTALADLGRINRLLAGDETYGQIEAVAPQAGNSLPEGRDGHDAALRWRARRRWRTPDTLLLPIAEAMGDLICRADFARVKNCEGPACTMWFHDISKNHTRRWCSMAVCGNRAKAAAHRAKLRTARSRPSPSV